MTDKVKQVVIVRRDLKMRRGKECAQSGHGFMDWLLKEAVRSWSTGTPVNFTPPQEAWIRDHITKVVLQADSEEQFNEVYRLAKEAGLSTHMVVDSGLTEFNGVPTKTVISIGPDWGSKIDEITGPNGKIPLKLY